MEHCPICGRDTPCTTVITRLTGKNLLPPIESHVEYRCIECWVWWRPNQSRNWAPMEKFNRRDLVQKGLLRW